MSESSTHICSFCDRGNAGVYRMISSPNGNICSECVVICVKILASPADYPAGAPVKNAGAAEAPKTPTA